MFGLLFLFPDPAQAKIIHSVQDIIYLTNQERIRDNLPALTVNSELTEAAHAKAQHMLDFEYFDHHSPDGREPWDFIEEAGYPYIYAGENLAINYSNSLATFQAWMDSPSHKENILFPHFQEIGIATHSAERDGLMVTVSVQMFGSRDDYSPFQAYLSDANYQPKKTESLVDKQTVDKDGKSGYVASSVSYFRDRAAPPDQPSDYSPLLWIILTAYCLIVIGLLFYFTQRQLFFSFMKKFAFFAWMLMIFLVLT